MSIDTFKDNITYETNPNKFLITPNGRRRKARINVETGISETHPEMAEDIVLHNPPLMNLYLEVRENIQEDMDYLFFLLLYGYISVDVGEGEEAIEYCSKSIDKKNEIELNNLIDLIDKQQGLVLDAYKDLEKDELPVFEMILERKKTINERNSEKGSLKRE